MAKGRKKKKKKKKKKGGIIYTLAGVVRYDPTQAHERREMVKADERSHRVEDRRRLMEASPAVRAAAAARIVSMGDDGGGGSMYIPTDAEVLVEKALQMALRGASLGVLRENFVQGEAGDAAYEAALRAAVNAETRATANERLSAAEQRLREARRDLVALEAEELAADEALAEAEAVAAEDGDGFYMIVAHLDGTGTSTGHFSDDGRLLLGEVKYHSGRRMWLEWDAASERHVVLGIQEPGEQVVRGDASLRAHAAAAAARAVRESLVGREQALEVINHS